MYTYWESVSYDNWDNHKTTHYSNNDIGQNRGSWKYDSWEKN